MGCFSNYYIEILCFSFKLTQSRIIASFSVVALTKLEDQILNKVD